MRQQSMQGSELAKSDDNPAQMLKALLRMEWITQRHRNKSGIEPMIIDQAMP
jgi:hypothetical protein